jgi:predicted enzyme related to lactoylglutathione lyase
LVHHPEHYKPSTDGVLIYFSSRTGDLADELSKIEGAGGQILVPKTLIAEDIGYMAVFLDTEGNRIALHSR